jgi:ribonuclease R
VGVTRFGLFVMLDESGADGLIPISTLPDDYYRHDDAAHCLRGDDNGREFLLGQRLTVTLAEANPITGGMVLRLTDEEMAACPALSGRRTGKNTGRTGRNQPKSSKGKRLAKRGKTVPQRKR